MELAPCLFNDQQEEFRKMIEIYTDLGYTLFDVNNGKKGSAEESQKLLELIPGGGSRNIIVRIDK